MPASRRSLYFVGDSLDVPRQLPRAVQQVEDIDGNTYRAVYTVKLRSGVYVLHCFQKKSKSGIATAKRDLDLIRRRLSLAIEQDKELRQ